MNTAPRTETNTVLEMYFTKLTNEVKQADPTLTEAQVFTAALGRLSPALRREFVDDRRRTNR